ncbi:MAG TPA: hypothetical protein VMV18_15095, partial [bacterium]|nr:hypothetical protein [bacterium]
YRAAREANAPGVVLDAIEACLFKSMGNLPSFRGKVISLVDNSGSARGATTSALGRTRMCDIGNLTGLLTGMRAEEGEVGVFGDGLRVMPVRRIASVFDQLRTIDDAGAGIGGGTENGIWIFFRDAIAEKKRYDSIFVYSDMQAGHGGLYGVRPAEYASYGWPGMPNHIDVAKLVKEYRAKVNPDVNVYLVQIAGYQDTLIPEFYDRTYVLGGWGEGLLRFADYLTRLREGGASAGDARALEPARARLRRENDD